MSDLYIFDNGKISRKDNTIYVETALDKKFYPITELNSIFIFGNISLNSSLISYLNKYKIHIFFFNYYGVFIGHYEPFFIKDYDVRIKQYESYLNKKRRAYISKKIVEAQKHNMYSFLKHYARTKKLTFDELRIIKDYSVGKTNVISYEARLWRYFYDFIKKLLPSTFDFHSRIYNPPDSEINSLISFINGLLYSYVLKEIFKTNLDPQISFLHSSNEKRNSLVFDIADIFKPYLTFTVLMRFVNLKIIKKDYFDSNFRLKNNFRKKIVLFFESLMNKTVFVASLKRYASIRYLIRLDLYKLIRYLKSDEEFDFFKKWW